jgi:hypothetical protein
MAKRFAVVGIVWAVLGLAQILTAQAPPATGDPRVIVESYYKIVPRKTEEWLQLYRTHHLPVLKQRQQDGNIQQILIYRPLMHQGAPDWDFKVILIYRDAAAFGDRIGFEAVERKRYADWEGHQGAERQRWEMTTKHWDDLMVSVPAE